MELKLLSPLLCLLLTTLSLPLWSPRTLNLSRWSEIANGTVSLTPPSVFIIFPANESYVPSSTINVTWSGDDDTGIDFYEVHLHNASWDSGWFNTGLQTWYVFSGLTEVQYWVEVNATDIEGNEVSVKHTFFVDLTPPSLQISDPPNNSYIASASVTVSWSGADNFGISEYLIYLDSSYVASVDASTTSYTFFGLSEGWHTARVDAVDYAGNVASKSVRFYVDLTPPTIVITQPSNGTWWNSPYLTVCWNASDDALLTRFDIFLNGSLVDTVAGTTTSYTFTSLPEGWYNITIVAVDVVDRTDRAWINVTIDLTPPTVTITSPSDGESLSYSDVTVQWTGSDNYGIDYFMIYLNGNLIDTVNSSVTSYTFTGLSLGIHTVTIMAYDYALNSGYDTVSFNVTADTTPPVVDIIAPPHGSYSNSLVVVIQWVAEDNVGIANQSVSIDWGPWIDVGSSVRSYTAILDQGQHWVVVNVSDPFGNSAADVVMFYIDAEPPLVEVRNPSDGAILNDKSVLVTWWGSDNGSSVLFDLIINGALVLSNTTRTSYLLNLTDGTWTIEVRGKDLAGNVRSAYTTFVVDTIPPNIGVVAPPDQSYHRISNVTIKWSSNDTLSGLAFFEVYLDGKLVATLDPATTEYNLTGLRSGIHHIDVYAIDRAGNRQRDSVTIAVDLVSPTVRITEPENDSVVDMRDVLVVWVANDNTGFDHFEVWVDGNTVATTLGPDTRSFLVKNLDDGQHVIEVRGVDLAGNMGVSTAIVRVAT